MYTSSPSSEEMSTQANTIPLYDPSPFAYLLETSSFTPTATVAPVYQYHVDQPAELNSPPSQFDVLYQSLALPASFDPQFYNASATHSTFPSPEIDLQQPITESSSILPPTFYRSMNSSSSHPLFSSNVNISIAPETESYSLPLSTLPASCAPFINNTTTSSSVSTISIQHAPQKEEHQQIPTSSNKKNSVPSSAPKPTHNTQSHEAHKPSSSSSSSKTYPCDLCDKVFHRAYNLKSHQLSHSKARPYECRFDACPWRFSRPHDLRRHEQLHAGHRPFGCSTCGKRFAQLEALQRHARGDTICLRIATMLAHAASISETTTTKEQ